MPASATFTDAPDLVLILTDQERAAPPYESAELTAWRRRALPGRRWFHDHGVRFERHYTGSTACVPSRPTLWTGHYPDVHGVTQTTGMAKEADDPRVRWLRPGEVPTLGHWLRAAGYDTRYEGKWHVSDADLRDPETARPLRSNRRDGTPIPQAVARYEHAQCLEPFGFAGWLGPEPHGADPGNSGMVRDKITAARAVRFLEERHGRRRAGEADALRPFCLVVCFVNPHDIVFWPLWALRSPLEPDALDPPPIPEAPTEHADLRDRPAAQAAYRDAYHGMYGPSRLVRAAYRVRAGAYRRTYMRLHLEVDLHIDRVRRAALSGPRAERTVLCLSSDHGELLGSHGGLHQKWHNLYDEAVRVPFVVAHTGCYGPTGVSAGRAPTSHVDLLPTLLGLAGVQQSQLLPMLQQSHSEAHPLVGRDLSDVVRGGAALTGDDGVYVMTRDNIAEGAEQRSLGARSLRRGDSHGLTGLSLPAFVATNMEALIARHDGRLWKLARTFDDPDAWTEPGVRNLADRGRAGCRYRSEVIPDAWELYELDADPAEADNRATDDKCRSVMHALQARLAERRRVCLPPRRSPWPYACVPGVDEPRLSDSVGPRYTLRNERRIAATPERLWEVLSDFGALSQWFPDATHSSLLNAQTRGIGTRRRVQLADATLVETAVTWQPPGELAYDIEGLPSIIRSARNTWSLRADGSGSAVALHMEVGMAPGLAARLAYHTVLRFVLARSLSRLLGGLSRAARR